MVFQNALSAFAQHAQRDAEALVGFLRSATDWNSRSTGAPRSMALNWVEMWARQQACVGML